MAKKQVIIGTETVVSVIEVKANGWTTVKLPDGTEKNLRTKTLGDIPKELAEKLKAEKPAAAPRVAKAAHYVSEVTGGEAKIAKIGKTEFDLSKYFVGDAKTESGRRTIDVNDEVATALRGMTLAALYGHVAALIGVGESELHTQYDHLNPGMQRMNLGNRIRGFQRQQAKAAAEAANPKPAKAVKEMKAEKPAKPAKPAKKAAATA